MAKKTTRRASTDSPYPHRIKRLRETMHEASIDHLLVTDPNDVSYLTGFLGGDSFLLVSSTGKNTIISDGRYDEELLPQRPMFKIFMREAGIMPAVAAVVSRQMESVGVESLGFQSEHLTMASLETLKTVLKKAKLGARLAVPTTGLVKHLRLCKDEHEIKLIKKACRIQEQALENTLPQIQFGMTELEVCAILEYEMKVLGSIKPGFTTIVAAQANGSLPHYRPAKTRIKNNSPLLIDWGAIQDGYHSDMTRTFCFGRWPKQVREIYEIVREAQQLAIDALKPGASTREVDAAARRHITKKKYGKRYNHGLGHGLGLEIHEDPRLSHMTADEELKPGMVVTIEPGIYLPGVGGVRLEDDYVITERGKRAISTLPLDLDWATL
ncbi:MAG: Xaa-Pro peptidase family protein [Planctomycetota bacterium]